MYKKIQILLLTLISFLTGCSSLRQYTFHSAPNAPISFTATREKGRKHDMLSLSGTINGKVIAVTTKRETPLKINMEMSITKSYSSMQT
jgi:starvation-inducible outer membrane lipoprotein